jgi:hypothetical protein
MSLEGVDHALGLRRDERDRISNDLLDLEGHTGHQLLKGAELSGVTLRRWEEARARLATLWWLFDAYRRVIDEAERLRAERSRPGAETLGELNRLLSGPSVELKAEDVSVERRSLVRAAGERLTLDEVVSRMDAAYQEVATSSRSPETNDNGSPRTPGRPCCRRWKRPPRRAARPSGRSPRSAAPTPN